MVNPIDSLLSLLILLSPIVFGIIFISIVKGYLKDIKSVWTEQPKNKKLTLKRLQWTIFYVFFLCFWVIVFFMLIKMWFFD
jgi:uncharacterized BrkB/YihY/UPF0761 family membrane protein